MVKRLLGGKNLFFLYGAGSRYPKARLQKIFAQILEDVIP